MANNRIQVKRSSTAGRTPNTTNAGNTQYIAAGELALNMTDQTFFTSDGTNLIYVGSNTINQNVSNTLTVKAISANGSNGTSGQVLTTNSTGAYWSTVSGGSTTYMKGGSATQGTLATEGQNIFRVNANTVNFDTTIAAGENAQATGPIAIASGKTLTVQTNGRVSII